MATIKPPKPPQYRPLIETVLRVKDGDTVDLSLDLGFDTWRRQTVRFTGIDTPETTTEAGKAVSWWLKQFLASVDGIRLMYLDSQSYDKYGGRVLGDIHFFEPGGPSLVKLMIGGGLGRAYKGTKRLPWTPTDLDAVVKAVSTLDPSVLILPRK